jgi:LacI family transcriptional regulator
MKIEEIARMAEVSRSTVSRVINNDPNVSDATREKVLQIVKQVDYRPNVAARGLAAGRTRVLGLVIPMGVAALFTDPYFPILIQGVSSACNSLDHSVMLWLAEPEYERRMTRQILNNGLIDGVILASALLDDPVGQALAESDLPFVMVGRHTTNNQVHYVDVENYSSSRDAVLHLFRQGRRRVGTVAGPANLIAGYDRQRGYAAALHARGLAVEPGLVAEGDFTDDGGYAAMQQLLPQEPDAVFVASDAMALGALRALREAGKRVPDEVAVVSFDDMPFAVRADPPLTTVRQPIDRVGATAAEMLISLIEHPSPEPHRIILPTELVIRDSCGARRRMQEGKPLV